MSDSVFRWISCSRSPTQNIPKKPATARNPHAQSERPQRLNSAWAAYPTVPNGDDEALNRWLLQNARTQHHSSGTCKMGPSSDPVAVVSPQRQMHAIQNLMVVDAAIMPDVIRANTNATTIMIAEKIAGGWGEEACHME